MTEPRSWAQISPFIADDDEEQQQWSVDDQNQPLDWSPAETCPVCAGKRFNSLHEQQMSSDQKLNCSKHKTSSSENNIPSTSTNPSETDGPKLNFDFLFSGVDSSRQSFNNALPHQAALFAPHLFPHLSMFGFGPTTYLQQLLQWSAMFNPAGYTSPSFLSPTVASQNGQLPSHTGSTSGQTPTATGLTTEPAGRTVEKTDEPLDLTVKSKEKRQHNNRQVHSDEKKQRFEAASSAGVSQFLAKAIPDYSKLSPNPTQPSNLSGLSLNGASAAQKRNYSQTDLDSAVKDIRSGRLGTRRASVVYGIPRSTLRNKIYKLEAAEENGSSNAKRFRRSGVCISTSPIGNATLRPDDSPPSSDSCSTSENNSESVNKTPVPPFAWDLSPKTGDFSTMWTGAAASDDCSASVSPTDMSESKDKEQTDQSNIDWKKLRPKRGQYRKYDKNALDEAVHTVRRGEMSVHRAGSFYGVPHSTLEYKVKERNLMRHRKKEQKKLADSLAEQQNKQQSDTKRTQKKEQRQDKKVDTPISDEKHNDHSKKERKLDERESSPLSKEILEYLKEPEALNTGAQITTTAAFPFLNGNGGLQMSGLWPNLGFGATESQSSFFASEMMRKLQEQVSSGASKNTDQS